MTDPGSKFVAAAVQGAPAYMDLEGTLDKTVELIENAASSGADLVVFPETWIPGYPYWAWLGPPAWAMQWVQRYTENSLVLGTAEEARIAAAAAANGIHVVIGASERAGGSLYISQIIFDAEGNRRLARRKLKPTHVERTIFGEGDGSDLAVCDLPIGRLGALSCWEHFQPLTKYAMYSQDEQVHAASWPAFAMPPQMYQFGPDVNDAASQMYAAEGGCFVVAASMNVPDDVIDLLCQTPEQRGLVLPGGGRSMIFGPDGSRLAEYLDPSEEGLILAEIDLANITLAKAAADPAGHYARPDVTRLLFNQKPARPVESFDPAGASSSNGSASTPADASATPEDTALTTPDPSADAESP